MSALSRKKKRNLPQADADVDLVPLIDCVFLLLLFFMLCGRLTLEQRTEQITVPPTKTANKFPPAEGWTREVVNVFGTTQKGTPPRNTIRLGYNEWKSEGTNDYKGYQGLRAQLDLIFDKAEKYDDPKGTKLKLPKVIIEIRADADTEYRVVQEVQQVMSDSMDLTTMQPKKSMDIATARPFINVEFTTRRPEDK